MTNQPEWFGEVVVAGDVNSDHTPVLAKFKDRGGLRDGVDRCTHDWSKANWKNFGAEIEGVLNWKCLKKFIQMRRCNMWNGSVRVGLEIMVNELNDGVKAAAERNILSR